MFRANCFSTYSQLLIFDILLMEKAKKGWMKQLKIDLFFIRGFCRKKEAPELVQEAVF
uniref:Uncharacterized protein n=1 Tax=Rhizophora mucronata TaxID=61149 RepID=A0A2P2IQL2_RHIMU